MRLVNADHAPIYLNESAFEQIKNMPSVDAVEVVMCKDCSWRICWEQDDDGRDICWVSGMYVRGEDDFCSYGERKGGSEDG